MVLKMKHSRKARILAGLVGVSLIGLAPAAFAQDVRESSGDDGYGYEFSDDPLSAGGFGPNDSTIRVRAKPQRTTLIRPRTSFVPEMLKSVEDL